MVLFNKKQRYIAKEYPRLVEAVYCAVIDCFPEKSFYRNLYKLELFVPNEIDRYVKRHQNDDSLTWYKIKDFIDNGGKNLEWNDMKLPKIINKCCKSLQITSLKKYAPKFTALVCEHSVKIIQSVARCSKQLEDIKKILEKKRSMTDEAKKELADLDNTINRCKEYEKKVDNFAGGNQEVSYLTNIPSAEVLYENLKKSQQFINSNSR